MAIIKTEPGHFYVTPVGFLVFAEDYYKASINWIAERKYSPVPYFLVCRSIELALKAFILIKGGKMKDLKTIGHNLILGLDKAEKLSLSDFILVTDQDRLELDKANEYYREKKKRFEYFDIEHLFRPELPDLIILQQLANMILKNTHYFIVGSA